jgi:hypothetical protein
MSSWLMSSMLAAGAWMCMHLLIYEQRVPKTNVQEEKPLGPLQSKEVEWQSEIQQAVNDHLHTSQRSGYVLSSSL